MISLTIEVGSPLTFPLFSLQSAPVLGIVLSTFFLFFHALKIYFSMAGSQSSLLLKKQLAGKYAGTFLS